MANDLDTISILVDSSQVRSAKQDIQDLGNSYNSAAKSASVFMQMFAKAAAQSARDAQYLRDVARANQEIINTNLKVSNSYSSAEESAASFTRELRKQEDQALKTARANQAAFNKQLGVNQPSATSGGAGFGAIESEILRLETLYNKVALAARVYEQAQKSLNTAVMMGVITADQKEAKLLELSMAYQKVGNDAGKAQAFINRFGENAQVSGRGLNQFGMVAQQVGYQVGDFLVQIQSGTNPLVAFGQQATQLAGLIPGVLGAALGIGISLTTALGAAWMRTTEGLMSSQEAVKGLSEEIKNLNSEIANLKGIQVIPDEAVALLSRQEDSMLEILALQEQMIQKERVVNEFREAGITSGQMYQAALAEVFAIEGQISELEKERAKNSELILEYQGLLIEKRKVLAEQEERSLSQELALLQEKIKYGEESVQVKALEGQQTLENYAEELRRLGLHQSIIDALVAQKAETIAAAVELENASASAELLESGMSQAAVDALRFAGVDLSGGVSAAAREAAVLAANMGIALSDAISIRNMRASETYSGRGGDPRDFMAGGSKSYNEGAKPFVAIAKAASGAAKSISDAEKAAKDLQKQLEAPLVSAVGSISDAFGDFVARGLSDFKGFVKSVISSFKNMIAQMIAMAVKNRIMLSLGIGGLTPGMAAAGQIAGLGSAGGMLGSLGIGQGIGGLAGGTGFLGGAGNAIAGLGGGGAGFFGIGANAAAAGGGVLATLGAAVPVLGAVAAVASLFKKKVTELDAGLKVTVNNTDALVQSFQKLKTSSFLGLINSTSVRLSEASPEVAGPLQGAIRQIRSTVLQAAEILNIGAEAFNDFSYDFQVSLKGLTEEQKAAKITEELNKMGDAFANLGGISGGFVIAQELVRREEEFKKRLEELRESDPVQFFIESFQADFKKIRLELLSGAVAVATAIGGSSKVLSDSIVSLGRGVEGAANRVNEFLMGAFSNLNKDLGYGGGPLSSLNRITERLNQILEPAQNAIRKIEDAYDKMQMAHMELRNSADATADEIAASERAIGRASRSMGALSVTFSTVSGGLSTLTSAVNDYFSSQVTPALELIFPAEAQKLSSSVKAILGTISEGSVSEFEAAFVNLTDAFGKGTVTAEQYNIAMRVMDQVFRGNISLTEEYTKRQKDAVDQISKSFESLRDNLRNIIDIVSDGIRNLVGAREDLTGQAVSRESAIRYLSGIALSGQIPQSGEEFSQAVSAASTVSTSQFRTSVEMLRYIGQTSGILNEIRTQAEQQLTDAQVQVQAILKIQETSQTSADALVSIESGIQAFLSAGGRIPQFANGGYHSGGLRIVGENGPELEATGPARIFNGNQISVGDTSELRNEVSQMRVELSTALIQIAKNTRKSADTLNKFDYQGLPAERGY